jgi:hypothetical protein
MTTSETAMSAMPTDEASGRSWRASDGIAS